ncbi:unnamed protein product [Blepharisma stoltei]|uniref:C2H2-type domain-containing protein n=1 Tax=Blepharisma stoltei TaxID=1481888 RepID=A0AAU9JTA2_9CILI|nr:unnamed protein product [Blepharisma stoltei]
MEKVADNKLSTYFIPLTQDQIKNEDKSIDYYEEFCKLFVYNLLLKQKVEELAVDKERFQKRLASLEESLSNGKKKRYRRTADKIERHYTCQVCGKSYGSEASVNNHLKLKHSS